MKSKIIKSDFKNLDKFVKLLSTNYAVQVGILGKKTNREDSDGQTNADIGFIHEFGQPSNGIPRRSFIRMPLQYKSEEILKEVKDAGALKKIAKGDFLAVLSDLGIACVGAIHNAFETAGFGSWRPNSPVTRELKGSGSPLIDTRQLERSIGYKVVKA